MNKSTLILILASIVLLQGCSTVCQNASLSSIKTIFDPNKPVHIVVNTTPLKPTKRTLDSIQAFFTDSLGLIAKITEVNLEITTKPDLTEEDLFEASKETLKHAKCPTLVIITVDHVKDFTGYGYCLSKLKVSHENGEQYPVTVIVLIRKNMFVKYFESTLLKHEVGHWVGVPARDCHIYKDNSHCSNLRCLMTSGPGSNPLRWMGAIGLSILFLGPPDFCNDCKQELAEMKTLHLQES
jgi:hypothetical protein